MLKILSRYFLVVIIYIFCGQVSIAQSSNDLTLINAHVPSSDLPDHSYQKNDKKTRFIQAVNPLYWIYKGGISFYQGHISSQLSTSCIYETSCSRFSKKLFNEYGLFKAIVLSADRIGRCNRMTYSQVSKLRMTTEGKVIENVSDFSFHK